MWQAGARLEIIMAKRLPKKCRYCGAELDKDSVGLNKKLFEADTKKNLYACLPCLGDILECTEEDLRAKIEDLKNEGCKLFA